MAEEAIVWTDEQSRAYARYMETNVKHDHRRWAQRIAADWPTLPGDATVVDVAGGPAFLLLELVPLLQPVGSATQRRLVVTDSSAPMLELAQQRARARRVAIESLRCPAERLALPDRSVDLLISKHFVRFASDVDAVFREWRRVLKPGGRLYAVDFNAEGPWLGKRLLAAWIQLTGPRFLRRSFWSSMASGLAASALPARLAAAGLSDPRVLYCGVSYLVRAERPAGPGGAP